jgi:hypothetical protein
MRVREFIRAHRAEVEEVIRSNMSRHRPNGWQDQRPLFVPQTMSFTMEDLYEHVINDEGLYAWARRAGCRSCA